MLDEELKKLWGEATAQERVKLDKALLLHDVAHQLNKLERGIRFRNMLEIGTAVFLLPLFLLTAIFIPFLLTKVGSVVIMVFCALVIFKLRKVRALKPTQLSKPMQEHLQEQRLYLYQEMQLLASVSYWYIAPFLIGFTLFILGFSEMGGPAMALRVAGGVVLSSIIYYLNRREVNKTFKPLLQELDKTIATLQA